MIVNIYKTGTSSVPAAPYLFVEAGSPAPLPDHPSGGEWVYFKDQRTGKGWIGADGLAVEADILAQGYSIVA